MSTDAAGRRAPGFELATIDGRRFSLAGARGKVVVLDFLAPGCPSCAASLRPLGRTALGFGPRRVSFVIVDVSGASDGRSLREYYYETYRLPRRVLIGEDRGFRIARAYRLNQLGLTFVIGRDGQIRWQGVWGSDERKLAAEIRAALAR
jgi:peroxiredoxin